VPPLILTALACLRAQDLDWVNITFDSPRGRVASAWTVTASGDGRHAALLLAVVVPPGVAAEVVSPCTGERVAVVGGTAVLEVEACWACGRGTARACL
jgi:hypothetical protein